MWDFDHPPLAAELAKRYEIDWMLPSACADRLADGTADIGLVPIAALATTPGLRIVPGCTIASKERVRSLLLVHSAGRKIDEVRTVAADTASRTTIAYTRLLFGMWGNPGARFLPMAADLDAMLAHADAAIIIGDPALMALEERENREERTGERLVYRDLAQEWRTATGLPFISAVWAARAEVPLTGELIADFTNSRDRGLHHLPDLVAEWSQKLPLPEDTIRTYLESNIHYVLDDECIAGMRAFFRLAAEAGILPHYSPAL
jgi:chorismate dehydratase